MVWVMKWRKKFIVPLIGIAICTTIPVQAAIPVIDTNNILQQIETVKETIKVTKNTAEQIKLQVKELAGLSQNILNNYRNSFNKSLQDVNSSLKTASFFTDSSDWSQYWRKTFPRISSGDSAETAAAAQESKVSTQEMLAMKNQQDVLSYHKLTEELDASNKRLQDLLNQNMSPEGSKQAAQIANQIAVEKAHIEGINLAMQAIYYQNQAMHNQAAVLEKQNHQAVVEASIKAEKDALEQMHHEVTKTAPLIDDPWTTYGNVRW